METLTTFPHRITRAKATATYDETRLNYLRLAFTLGEKIEDGDQAAIDSLRAAAQAIVFARELQW